MNRSVLWGLLGALILVGGTVLLVAGAESFGDCYWGNFSASALQRASLDTGEAATTLFDSAAGVRQPYGIALDLADDSVYWANYGDSKIMRSSIDGTRAAETLFSGTPFNGLNKPYGVALDLTNNRVYWASHLGACIQCGSMDGAG